MRAPYSVHKRQYRHYYRHRDETLRAYALDRIVKGYALRISTLQRHSITPEDIRAQLIVARERGLLDNDSTRRYSALCAALYPGHQWIHKLAALGEGDFAESDVTWLAHYVNNRAQWLKDLMAHYACDRSAAKALLLSAMFGGKPENHYEELGIKPRDAPRPLQKLVEELSVLRPRVIAYMTTLPKYKAVYDLKLVQKGSAAAAERSVFALITQEIEDCVMGVIREYMGERGIEIYSLIHDGFIAAECSEELLRGIEAHVAEYGWTIELAEKSLHGMQDEPVPELAPLVDEPVSLLNVYHPGVDYTPLKADDWLGNYFSDWTAPCTYWETA